MSDKTWKARERQVAKFFGTERNPLSGQNSKHTSSDTLHQTLYIEHKHRAAHTLLGTWRKAKDGALRESEDRNCPRVPVVTISEKGKPGFWVLCHSSDLLAVANQREKVRGNGVD